MPSAQMRVRLYLPPNIPEGQKEDLVTSQQKAREHRLHMLYTRERTRARLRRTSVLESSAEALSSAVVRTTCWLVRPCTCTRRVIARRCLLGVPPDRCGRCDRRDCCRSCTARSRPGRPRSLPTSSARAPSRASGCPTRRASSRHVPETSSTSG